ncbi:expansin-like A1 isoform X2 [Beta vulgaris subsp. vulgaris]|uniref:expansin-like A1 isoform X2 n=1 Tax=Beta vulgaris subsp. vulgaris TaxID=3555 RepID=UPI002036BCFC|nr:expansin-like A1 isoform X2 [Beta vulgaris subsp. vulgaris]
MALFLCFIFMLFSSASAACNQCVLAKAAFFASSKGGACGYGPLALNLYGGHVAAALPPLYKKGEGCGACYQIRCKKIGVCNTKGTTIVVTDIHTDKSNTTDFVLSSRAFRAMALPAKDKQLLQIGIADVEYKRVPCVYKGQNLAIRVEEFSKPSNYLAIKVLYQGGQTNILGAEVASVNQPSNWISMSRNYGVVWDTSKAPTGKLMFRFIINSGFDAQYFYTQEILPANWKPGVTYTTKVQINNVALDGCTPCKPWK